MSNRLRTEVTVSKSQRKRDALALQELGKELTQLSAIRLQQLPLPAGLISAIEELQRLPRSHGARRRQLQYIGRLMRQCDESGIRQVLSVLQLESPYRNQRKARN